MGIIYYESVLYNLIMHNFHFISGFKIFIILDVYGCLHDVFLFFSFCFFAHSYNWKMQTRAYCVMITNCIII